MSNDLDSSLTEMDWLARLNVGGALAGFMDPSSSDGSEDCSSGGQTGSSSDEPGYPAFNSGRFYDPPPRNANSKPPFSYTHLISSAIKSSPGLRMALSEIYQWIIEHYPYYRTAGPGWKNSVRHNLSLNKHFVKVARNKEDPGKGSYWALESSVHRAHEHSVERNQRTLQARHQPWNEKSNGGVYVEEVQVNLSDSEAETINAINNIKETSDHRTAENEVSTLVSDCNVNGDLGESFRTIFRNALQDYPISNDDWLTQLDWLKESMRMDDLDLEMLMKCVKSGGDKHPEDLADLSASLSHYLASTHTASMKEELLLNDYKPNKHIIDDYHTSDVTTLREDYYHQYINMRGVGGGIEPDDDVSFDLGSQIHYSHINSGHVIHQIHPATQDIEQGEISVGNPYPQQSIPVGSIHTTNSYTQLIDDIEDDFNWDRIC